MSFTKPKKLKPGDTLAIISPSWGGPSVFPYIYENGLEILKEWGLKIKEGKFKNLMRHFVDILSISRLVFGL